MILLNLTKRVLFQPMFLPKKLVLQKLVEAQGAGGTSGISRIPCNSLLAINPLVSQQEFSSESQKMLLRFALKCTKLRFWSAPGRNFKGFVRVRNIPLVFQHPTTRGRGYCEEGIPLMSDGIRALPRASESVTTHFSPPTKTRISRQYFQMLLFV